MLDLLVGRDIHHRNRCHLVLKNLREGYWWLKRVIKSHENIAESADMTFATHSHGFVALLIGSLPQLLLRVWILDLGDVGDETS